MAQPPAGIRAIVVLAKVALRRRLNRLGSKFLAPFGKKRGQKLASERTATPRKLQPKGLLLLFVGLMLVINGVNIWSMFLSRLGETIDKQTVAIKVRTETGAHTTTPSVTRRHRVHHWPSARFWRNNDKSNQMTRTVGFVLFMLGLSTLFTDLGMRNMDLGKADWDLEWLFSLPVSARTLFANKVIEYAIASPFMWMFVLPFLIVIFCSARSFWPGVLLALGVAIYTALILAAMRLLIEIWLKKKLSKTTIKNLQAAFTVAGVLFFTAVWSAAVQQRVAAFLIDVSQQLPALALWLPWAAPVMLCKANTAVWGPIAVVLEGTAAIVGALAASSYLVRDGLITASGAYVGTRSHKRKMPTIWFRGIFGKDLTLLLRDHNLLVQITIVPAILIGYQLVLRPSLLTSAHINYKLASVVAFGVAAFILMTGASAIAAFEARSMWLLFTFPVELQRILKAKARFWGSIAFGLCLITLALMLAKAPNVGPDAFWKAGLAVAGAIIYSHIAAAISVIYVDPYEKDTQKAFRPEMGLLFMLLAAMYAFVIYAPSVYASIAGLVMSILIAYAIWQFAVDRLPLILDPVVEAPHRIGMIDGLVAAYVFFVVQGVIRLPYYTKHSVPSAEALLVIYFFSALFATLVMTYFYARAKVPDLLKTIGLKASSKPRTKWPKALTTGMFYGLFAAVFAVAYLKLIDLSPPLLKMKRQSLELFSRTTQHGIGWFVLLILLLAPVFEEFIFRGLLFKGMRRTSRPFLAIIGSATVFALVHPPISALPVFGLGIATAISFERTGLLIAPIATHVIYNGLVLAAQLANRA